MVDILAAARATSLIKLYPQPYVTAVSPASGATAGGFAATVTGGYFTDASSGTLGRAARHSRCSTCTTSCVARQAAALGSGRVCPTLAEHQPRFPATSSSTGSSRATGCWRSSNAAAVQLAQGGTHPGDTNPIQVLSPISRTVGTHNGSGSGTITGSYFSVATSVKFRKTAATSFTVNSDTFFTV